MGGSAPVCIYKSSNSNLSTFDSIILVYIYGDFLLDTFHLFLDILTCSIGRCFFLKHFFYLVLICFILKWLVFFLVQVRSVPTLIIDQFTCSVLRMLFAICVFREEKTPVHSAWQQLARLGCTAGPKSCNQVSQQPSFCTGSHRNAPILSDLICDIVIRPIYQLVRGLWVMSVMTLRPPNTLA